jgi:putative Mg2+ transporter-C (MgtC) family protein
MTDTFSTSLSQIIPQLARVACAYILALPIGWNREMEEHGAGVRTFPLVAMASCGFVLLGVTLSKDDPAGLSRIIQGLIAGIGFIGGGAILKGHAANGVSSVHGTATAASIWNMGVMGAAVAQGRYDIGLLLTLLNYFTLRVMAPWKQRLETEGSEDRTGNGK